MTLSMRTVLFSGLGLILLGIFSCEEKKKAETRPNILLIVADDLGYSDLGCFGSDIRTPNIDRLAAHGLRFSRFHTAPTCAPTRAMLLTGNNNHVAGMGNQGGVRPNSPMYGKQGYEGHLSDRIIPLPVLLKEAGYQTYMAGKWHLGKEEEDSPKAKGFDRSYGLLQGAGNHFNNVGIEPSDTLSSYREDGQLVEYPEGEYSTDLYTRKLMQFIKEGKENAPGQPFFAFAAYTSPHWPLQVPDGYLDRYAGDYDMGYDSLRVMRFNSLKDAGIIPRDLELRPRLNEIMPWDSLSDDDKRSEARKMELYAAMVDNLDYHVGQLIQFLKTEELYDNTLIVFMSDNGAAGNDFYNEEWSRDFVRSHYNNAFDSMGRVSSFVSYGPQWAQAGAAPFNRYKGFATEGGISAPLILSGKGIPDTGEVRHEYFTVADLAPTFYELAGVTYPGKSATSKTQPLVGNSILPYLQGTSISIHDENYGLGLAQRGHLFYRKGDWKLVQIGEAEQPKLMLFNVVSDPGETNDLAESEKEKFDELVKEWKAYIKTHNIILPK
ncbi:MAG TPA: arylsulfatase [Cyclobacteriaceae bacterium]|nr:arylsulfatase [Cyclobacteriaceae bacterium]